ncbi:hypothetical protein [Novosphingobium sp. PP1Y]|uniref:hypothetical protein n=1 Tax=Novosphingobium sp. PP1Y TaxID=702113 RepID=UPI00020EF047|nr:hypothetical protein [Novosphingobium sp. PP1Y]CCA93791.1 conserved hypothetical protein [Novosphingobium sp. PP1Y]
MRKSILAGGSALALAALPGALLAQNAPPAAADPARVASAAPVTLTPEQQAMYDGWPADRQAEYDAWPDEYKGYYWTLVPERQEGYWALTPDQRGQVYKMSPQQRETAWASIIQQLNGETPTTPATQANPPGEGMPTAGVPAPQAAEQAVRPAMPADESYQGGPYKGALTPPPASAMNKDYPVCSKTVQDSCRNPGGK